MYSGIRIKLLRSTLYMPGNGTLADSLWVPVRVLPPHCGSNASCRSIAKSNMSAGPFHAFLLDREDNQDPITAWRSLLSTELRPRYGISDTRNSFHGSSDPDEAEREATAFWTL